MRTPAPLIDSRDAERVLADLLGRLPGYTPEWTPRAGTPGTALMQVFARYMELFITGLNQVLDLHFLAFLDSLGFSLLPAQAARVPLVFTLQDNSPADTTLPANSQVVAESPPSLPSALLEESTAIAATAPVRFATTRTVTLTRARLTALYCLDPSSDAYADHTQHLTDGFILFDAMQAVEHGLYLGHDEYFALAGDAQIILSFTLGPSGAAVWAPRDLSWEYLSKDGWLPLAVEVDGTEGLTSDGELRLSKTCGPDAAEEAIGGHKSHWIRGRLATPFSSEDREQDVPAIDVIRASVEFTKSDLPPEAAFTDTFRVDTANTFFPFGVQPRRYTTFYLASKEVFQRRGARITLTITLAEAGLADNAPRLAWEYHNGAAWKTLTVQDDTANFTDDAARAGEVAFDAPVDWNTATVNGVENYWLRARIESPADPYGHPARYTVEDDGSVTQEDATLQPPVIASLHLNYTYATSKTPLDHCLAYNDFTYADHSHTCRWPRQTFTPFMPLADAQPAVYLGFDRALPQGLISLYVHVPEDAVGSADTVAASAFSWEYRAENGWMELGVLDETKGFLQSGMIQFIGPADIVTAEGPGGALYHIRARLKQGERMTAAPVSGVWLNAVWATHREAVTGEILGNSDGNLNQTFFFQHRPVLAEETVEVREWHGIGSAWETAIEGIPEEDLRYERDAATGAVTAVWVRWYARDDFYGSSAQDRHYVLERTNGWLRFGDGQHGFIPPAGARITASYNTGGGLAGNIPAEARLQLYAAVPFVAGVTNPVAAEGGAAAEAYTAALERGPQRIRHRDRAVAAGDFAWLAREASPAVALARCQPTTGAVGSGQRGWVTLVVVPHSLDEQPRLTTETRRRIETYLSERAPAALAAKVRVISPVYIPVGVAAEVTPCAPEDAAQVEALVRERLNQFLHPLTGGPDGGGWDFGQGLYLSQMAALLESTPGVDYARHVRLLVAGQVFDTFVPVDADALIAPGDHEIRIVLGEA